MLDPEASQETPPVDRYKGTVQEEVHGERGITPNASSAGFELDEEANLRCSFPFFLDV